MDILTTYLIPLLVPFVLGIAVQPFMQLLKKFSTTVDGWSPAVKRLVVGILSLGAVQLSTLLGVQFSPDVLAWDSEAVTTVLTALMAFATHFLIKKES